MRLLFWLLIGMLVLGRGSMARGQAAQPATTVQLPSFSVFSVQTTVSVPDRGGMVLGGADRGVDRTVTRGPLRNRGLSSTRAASGMSIGATIIDHAELDRAVLAEAAAERGAAMESAVTKAGTLSRAVAREERSSSLPDSVSAIRERSAAVAELESTELAGYFAKARQAEVEGKTAVARIFYDMVARRDKGQLKQQALARLAAIGTTSATAKR